MDTALFCHISTRELCARIDGARIRIGIISDSHDHVWNLRAALGELATIDALICCGNLCSPFIIGMLGEGYKGRPIHVVFGNNDGDLFRICYGHAQLHLHEQHDRTLLLNPGTLHGYEPGSRRDGPVTFAIYNTVPGEAEFFQVVDQDGERVVKPLTIEEQA